MIDAAIEIWMNLALFGDPILAGVLAAAALGMLSPLVVQRHMAMAVAAVAQSAGAGAALGFLLVAWGYGLPVEVVALLVTLLTAGWLFSERQTAAAIDSRIAFVFVLAMAASLLIRAGISAEAHEIDAVLFGTAVLVSRENLVLLAAVAVPCMAWLLWWFRGLRFALFDPLTAGVHGLPVALLRFLFGAVLALLIALGSRTVGVLPIMAYAVLPGLVAAMLTVSLRRMVWIAPVVAVVASLVGYVVAYWLDLPVGPVQAMVLVGFAAAAAGLRYR